MNAEGGGNPLNPFLKNGINHLSQALETIFAKQLSFPAMETCAFDCRCDVVNDKIFVIVCFHPTVARVQHFH